MIRSRRSDRLTITGGLAIALAGVFAALPLACTDLETNPGGSSGTSTTTGTGGSTTGTGGSTSSSSTGTGTSTDCVPKDGPLPFDKLSDYCLFQGPLADLIPAEGVEPYQVAAALWSDHAAKQRLIRLPKGQKIKFDVGEGWQFPTGTILVKTFSFYDDFRDLTSPHHIIETRLLILGDAGWTGHVYRWNDEQTEAVRKVAGDFVDLSFIDEDGKSFTEEYIVPNTNQCKSCHERDHKMVLLGPFTHQMNRLVEVDGKMVNQLEHMAEKGMFDGPLPDSPTLPAFADPFGNGLLDDRARAYLHANCSHCHRPGGGAGASGLVLLAWETTPSKNGVCKKPAAAGPGTGGHQFDIVPGEPDESIMPFRMSSVDPAVKMPQLPNRVPDARGVALIREWIAKMDPTPCL